MTDLPENFRHIRLELAREEGLPEGDNSHGYDILAPLQADGKIDGDTATAHKASCRVRRFRDGEEDMIGVLERGPGGQWKFDYDDSTSSDDEAGYRFSDEHFILGEYVSLREADGNMHTFRVVRVNEL